LTVCAITTVNVCSIKAATVNSPLLRVHVTPASGHSYHTCLQESSSRRRLMHADHRYEFTTSRHKALSTVYTTSCMPAKLIIS